MVVYVYLILDQLHVDQVMDNLDSYGLLRTYANIEHHTLFLGVYISAQQRFDTVYVVSCKQVFGIFVLILWYHRGYNLFIVGRCFFKFFVKQLSYVTQRPFYQLFGLISFKCIENVDDTRSMNVGVLRIE